MSDQLISLVKLADAMTEEEHCIVEIEATLSAAKERFRALREEDIPALMQELEITQFKLSSGFILESTDAVIYASLTEENQDECFAWIEKHGFGDIIKTLVALQFGKEGLENAQLIYDLLSAIANKESDAATLLIEKLFANDFQLGTSPTLARSIHYQTLGAFLRERMREEKEFPLELFNAYATKLAKLKAPPKPKVSKARKNA